MQEKKEYFFEYNMGFMQTVATIIMLVVFVISWILMKLLWGDTQDIIDYINSDNLSIYFKHLIIIILVTFLWMVLHEIIHGLFYIIGGAKRKNITYGAALEKGIFFCRCGEYVNKRNIMGSLMAPFTIIGVITLIIGLITKQWWLVLLSAMNIGGAGADLCMFFFFLKRNKDVMFMEYGDSSYFSLKTEEDLTNQKFKCVKQISKEKVPSNENQKKLTITKSSWIVLIVFIILIVLSLILANI